MLDIFFLSYDEPNADKNFELLKSRFPHARRIHGIKGIGNAHRAAAKKANTSNFYVVDADAEILSSFHFLFKPNEHDKHYVHVWYAFNPAIDQSYGYGGVKMFNKKMFSGKEKGLDFTSTISENGLKIHEEVACITHFNSDHLRAFRGAFREAVKLSLTINNSTDSAIVKEAKERLKLWLNPCECEFREYIRRAARAAVEEVKKSNEEEAFVYINDHDYIVSLLYKKFPEVDFNRDPYPKDNNLMKNEIMFTTKLASALYDDFVIKNLPMTEFRDAISDGQLLSKLWLVEKFQDLLDNGTIKPNKDGLVEVAILGGWIGTLPLLLSVYSLPVNCVSIDTDERANTIARKINAGFKFTAINESMYNVNYSPFDVIINTSSEHIPDISGWAKSLPENKIVFVQNNDFLQGEGHISNVKNSNELRDILGLRTVHYEGSKKLPIYNRFMIIGST